jgi:hypothetical protein
MGHTKEGGGGKTAEGRIDYDEAYTASTKIEKGPFGPIIKDMRSKRAYGQRPIRKSSLDSIKNI